MCENRDGMSYRGVATVQKELVKKAKKGDEDSFYTLMMDHKDQLYRIAYAHFKNEQDSLEAIQEVTFRAFKSIKKLKEPQYFSTWLIRIMINYCSDERKKKKKVILQGEQLEVPSIDQHPLQLEVEEAVNNLDEPYHTVIYLKYLEDLKIKEIAEVMDSPEGTVKTWLSKGLRLLRDYFDDKGGKYHV